MAEFAADQKYDAVLVRTPNYYAPQMTPLAMLTYFRTVADHSPLPVVLYTIPKFTHYDLATEVIAELARHPNIIGLKDSSGDVQRLSEISIATHGVARRHNLLQVRSFPRSCLRAMRGEQQGVQSLPLRRLRPRSKRARAR
jgi:dihydrodipicolinate synthase/N-acetylneuraminate lyase